MNADPFPRLWPRRPPRAIRMVLRLIAAQAMQRSFRRTAGAAAFVNCHRTIVRSFLFGYTAALEGIDERTTVAALESVTATFRGFAYEGAAMAIALLDAIPGQPPRLSRFIHTIASRHVYMAYVGAGWAAARLRRDPEKSNRSLDSVLGWLSVDGYGFHEGYFHGERTIRRCQRPRRLDGYAARVFDQGVGRCLWFAEGADVNRIADSIQRFGVERRSDLWSGVGLAAAYAGGADVDDLRALRTRAASYTPNLAQGAAFAAEARARADNPAAHTDVACTIFASLEARDAAMLVRECRARLAETAEVPAYEAWRQSVAAVLVATRDVKHRFAAAGTRR